jgi:hypothetical protein
MSSIRPQKHCVCPECPHNQTDAALWGDVSTTEILVLHSPAARMVQLQTQQQGLHVHMCSSTWHNVNTHACMACAGCSACCTSWWHCKHTAHQRYVHTAAALCDSSLPQHNTTPSACAAWRLEHSGARSHHRQQSTVMATVSPAGTWNACPGCPTMWCLKT